MLNKRDLLIASLAVTLLILVLFVMVITQIRSAIIVNEIELEITPLSTINYESHAADNSNPPNATAIPGVFTAGYTVKIFNTGGEGLRIRLEPGLDGQPMFLGAEGEEFVIVEGPNISDNKVWWFIEGINDTARAGWAAQDYLMIVN